ncbi:WXG100 family type VII secretion target [Mycobacterium sp. 3519A]|uniref:WXG100 family type VII secretion target n=1 Tax=Mycobacterium sp. 3519A TaxID=2057184 RepID=UPI000C7A4861|nr:WXG100 family type VII secretion target [Mycobacterium sp. 3519A]
MTVSLTPAEADAKISQINDARDQAVAKLKQIEDTQQNMLASAWHGGSATNYSKTSAQQQEDFNQIINTLNDIVEKGAQHIRSVANQDNG